MSRELKRVALDFDYPMKKVWEGYLRRKKYDPPGGEGYQLWETTSEGSPLSPVFTSLESLCVWCERNATTFGKYTATKEDLLIVNRIN